MNRFRVAFGGAVVAVIAAALIAPAARSAPEDARRRAVDGWLIEDVADEQGRRTLAMTREADEYSLDFHLVVPSEAMAFDSQGFLVWRRNCGRGGEESLDGGLAGLQAAAVRARLAAYLARCETPVAEAEALLSNFDRAFAQLIDWAREVQTAAPAERALDEAENAVAAAAAAVEAEADKTTDNAVVDPPPPK